MSQPDETKKERETPETEAENIFTEPAPGGIDTAGVLERLRGDLDRFKLARLGMMETIKRLQAEQVRPRSWSRSPGRIRPGFAAPVSPLQTRLILAARVPDVAEQLRPLYCDIIDQALAPDEKEEDRPRLIVKMRYIPKSSDSRKNKSE